MTRVPDLINRVPEAATSARVPSINKAPEARLLSAAPGGASGIEGLDFTRYNISHGASRFLINKFLMHTGDLYASGAGGGRSNTGLSCRKPVSLRASWGGVSGTEGPVGRGPPRGPLSEAGLIRGPLIRRIQAKNSSIELRRCLSIRFLSYYRRYGNATA